VRNSAENHPKPALVGSYLDSPWHVGVPCAPCDCLAATLVPDAPCPIQGGIKPLAGSQAAVMESRPRVESAGSRLRRRDPHSVRSVAQLAAWISLSRS
jgi:hypothetical protein